LEKKKPAQQTNLYQDNQLVFLALCTTNLKRKKKNCWYGQVYICHIYFGVITIIPFDNLYRWAYFVMHTFLVLFNNISGGAPNYFPNSFSGPADNPQHLESTFNISGDVKRYNTADDDNYSQVGVFWKKV
jgi:hypothetical protein